METTKQKPAPQEKQPGGIMGDFHRLQTNGTATVAEIREFLAQTKGKSPQEVMGLVAGSNLVWSTLIATAAILVGMALLTAGPYAVGKLYPEAKPEGPAKPAPAAAEAPQPAETAAADQPKTNKDKALSAMNMDEAKPSDPTKNPLENNKELENLLDKID